MKPYVKYVRPIIMYLYRNIFLFGLLSFVFSSCQPEVDEAEIRAMEINDLISGLQYNASELLNEQPTGNQQSARVETNSSSQNPYREGGQMVSCVTKEFNLQSNFEEIAILRPTNGVIFPGALVIGDHEMLDGAPTPLVVDRAPANLSIDLPGMAENGNLVVENPNNGTVRASIDEALEWWNANAYEEGYVNPSYISYKSSSSFSSEQVSIDIGLNVSWAAGEVASEFSYASTKEKKVAMMSFKQGFYSVTLNTPQKPSEMFAPDLNISDLENKINSGAPPAYVHSVIYGRIIVFRMETTLDVSSTELALALEYSTGVTSVSGSTEASVKKILANSTTTVITIGGNAAVASEAVSARSFGDLEKIIKGENAVYSRNNPGVPIAYTIRYLKDNQLAKMGYTTDYAVTECSRSLVPGSVITIQNDALYNVRAVARYRDANGVSRSKSSGELLLGQVGRLSIPDGAYSISLDVDFKSIGGWFDHFTRSWSVPTRACYKTWGTLFDTRWGSITCN